MDAAIVAGIVAVIIALVGGTGAWARRRKLQLRHAERRGERMGSADAKLDRLLETSEELIKDVGIVKATGISNASLIEAVTVSQHQLVERFDRHIDRGAL